MSCSVSDNYEFFILFSVKVLYKPSTLCYNAIYKIAFAISVREIQYNIMGIMFLPPISVAFFIVSAAYSPYADGVLCLLR